MASGSQTGKPGCPSAPRFTDKALPTDLPLLQLMAESDGLRLPHALKEAGLASSNGEANRKLAEGAVRIDGERVTDRETRLPIGAEHILQLGPRRFARVRIVARSELPEK